MKTLFITTQFPYPMDNGGKIGALNGIEVISSLSDVTVLSFTEERNTVNEGLAYFQDKLPRVTFDDPVDHLVHIRKKPLKLIKTMLSSYASGVPYVAAKFDNAEMYKRIDACFEASRFDIVFIDYLNMYQYAAYIRKKYAGRFSKMLFKNHNIEYEIVEQESKKQSGLKKLLLDIEWRRTRNYETKAVAESSMVFTVCDENTQFFRQHNPNVHSMKPICSLNAVDYKQTSKNSILYVGNVSWQANMEGLKWFVDNSWQKIRQQVPDAQLNIVGSGNVENPFTDVEGVNFLGYVDDLDALYQQHRAFVVPLFEGSGIRIKILEAFNNEIPVVSTTLACETIGATHAREIMVADTADDFARSVIKLLQSDELNRQQAALAKTFLKQHFSLASRKQEFQDLLLMES